LNYLLKRLCEKIGKLNLYFNNLTQQGFGAGNFKALFEAIELDQDARGNL